MFACRLHAFSESLAQTPLAALPTPEIMCRYDALDVLPQGNASKESLLRSVDDTTRWPLWIEDDDSRLLLRDVCVNNCRKVLEGQWDQRVAERIVYRSKGSTTLTRDRAHALRSVSLWRLAGVGITIAWLVRFVLLRLRQR